MKAKILTMLVTLLALSLKANAVETVTLAKVLYIDEWDTGFTRVQLDRPTACGGNGFWVTRTNPNYNLYMTRVLAALTADRMIRIVERAPAVCQAPDLYDPRIGVN